MRKMIWLPLRLRRGLGRAGRGCTRRSSSSSASSTRRLAQGQGGGVLEKAGRGRHEGRVKIEVYPNSSLYKDKEELEALQLGSVQMLAPTLGKFSAMGLKDYEAFDLPYLFDNSSRCTR